MSTPRLRRSVLAVLAAVLPAAGLSAQPLDPAAYLDAARAAVSLPRVVAAYNAYIDAEDPVFYGIFDADLATRSATLPTVDGPAGGTLLGLDGFFYFRLFKLREISFRALLLPSVFAFSMDSATASAYTGIYGDQTSMKWVSGYALMGVQARRGEDRLTLGAVLRIEPLVDEGANEFDRVISGDTARTETTELDRFYADFSLGGWRFGTLISGEYLEQLAVEKLFGLVSGLAAGPAVEYLGRASSFRPGVTAEWVPADWFRAAATAKLGIGPEGAGLGEAGLSLGFRRILVRNVRDSGKDMTLRLGAEASVVELEGTLLPGAKAELTLGNYPFLTWFDAFGLRYLGTLTLGVSWNHADTLLRMPFEDQLIVYVRTGGGYYARPKTRP